MPHSSHTLAIGERMTPAKAEVYIARCRPDVEAAAIATVAQVQRGRPTTEGRPYRAALLHARPLLWRPRREPAAQHPAAGAGLV